MGYLSNGTLRSTVWCTGRMEHGGLECDFPVGLKKEFFSVV